MASIEQDDLFNIQDDEDMEEEEEEQQPEEQEDYNMDDNVQQGNDDDDEDMNDEDGEGDEDEEDDDEDDNKDNEKKTIQEAQDKSVTHKPSFNTKTYTNDNIFMSSSIDGTINLWDVRTPEPVLRLGVSENTPPWCMTSTWSNDGEYIYVGRRNSTVEEFSIRMPYKRATHGAGTYHHSHTHIPNVSKLLQFPTISGPVSAISTMPNSNFLLCGSNDNIRLYNLSLYDSLANTSINVKKQATPFLIIPGHNGGTLSQLYVDQTGRFMVSASGNRGWGHGTYTDAVLVYEIDFEGI
ncbi:uncharacterized protein SPAPADRAFT_61338 [Spathaspora passalidarum NRRL Y-27907]|uniref:Transcription factor spt8 beta-propeller domain-containing protein n=1 Tax=Spathaspora passalidarum (strain NRRL Y-27907 / 11-Y1) TaxID=619300 RepID=G3APT5_SPAPN|nr:uncharacterized protein SPAPADRAFT_61338 [Spathaspora passalidarum NRRL Y-27907]EGW32256.1 hypothetical protein SPAPADRAFT_61338 [Spathaspora passalidarum NRRL Y-27907]